MPDDLPEDENMQNVLLDSAVHLAGFLAKEAAVPLGNGYSLTEAIDAVRDHQTIRGIKSQFQLTALYKLVRARKESDTTKIVERDHPDDFDLYLLVDTNKGKRVVLMSAEPELYRYEESVFYEPKTIDVLEGMLYERLYTNLQDQDHQSALASINALMELHPDNAVLYSNRAIQKRWLGDVVGAREDLERAIQLGACSEMHLGLAEAEDQLMNPGAAEQHLRDYHRRKAEEN